MNNIAFAAIIFLAVSVAVGQDATDVGKSVPASGQSVCAAAKTASKKHVFVHGAAGITSDGLVMADYSCALATGPHGGLPMMILVDVRAFTRPEDMRRFEAKSSSFKMARETAFSARLFGDLECQTKFRIQFNEQGEFVGANGYGYQGFAKCRIKNAQVLQLKEIERSSVRPH